MSDAFRTASGGRLDRSRPLRFRFDDRDYTGFAGDTLASALLANGDGTRLCVASATTDRVSVVDTRQRAEIAQLVDAPSSGPAEGRTPNALALSGDGTRLFAAEADANAVAVFDLSSRTAGVSAAT